MKQEVVQNFDEFLKWLKKYSDQRTHVYRGHAVSTYKLQPSIDRCARANCNQATRLREEQRLMRSFRGKASRFLGHIERQFLAQHTEDPVVGMTVMQHYWAPTRLLDWTWSAAIAAYFACIDESQKDGAVWILDHSEVVDYVTPRWEKWGFKRPWEKLEITKKRAQQNQISDQIKYSDRIFDTYCPKFVSMVYLQIAFPRAQAQRGLFTIGSRLGMRHDVWINRCLPKGSLKKIIIRKNIKNRVVEYLRRLGIDAVSLHHPGADQTGLKMSWDR